MSETIAKTRPHLSLSSIRTYLRCPMQWYWKYIEEVRVCQRLDMAMGKAIHQALELNFNQKISSKKDLKTSVLLDKFSDVLEKSKDDLDQEERPQVSKVKDEGIEIIKLYQAERAPNIQPLMVEQEIRFPMTQEYDYLGYIDLIDDKGIIIDHKVVKSRLTQLSIDLDLQLSAYAWAYRMFMGKEETGLAIDQMVRTKKPQVERIPTVRTIEQILRFLRISQQVWKSISLNLFYPTDNAQVCSWCSYFSICQREATQKRRQAEAGGMKSG